MKDRDCRHEDSVIQALRPGQWSQEVRDHVAQCTTCAEIGQVSEAMGNVAKTWTGAQPASDSGVIWLKAQLAEEQRRRLRALRWGMVAQAAVRSLPPVAISLLILWIWPALNLWFTRFLLWTSKAFLEPPMRLLERPLAVTASPLLILSYLALVLFLLHRYWRKPA